ncbi:ABC transporter substrate-binding protein [Xylanimonas oleitrophica]|uniref:ABC transporter substrate-binding protein n=1 Tax=Xylanimonas oleitrophica TaxID=2607479 RepID=A0A2W5WV69_9MICO|nr:extracellular solute-binding protein [Xylanimonas oleitrophica]PZR52166.1 ABC transporter substrate-binding protein [Xylanimonas oleitrophica]
MTRKIRGAAIVALGASIALLASGCAGQGGSSSSSGSNGGDENTITWWHNSNTGEGKEFYDKVAADFEAANPGVTVQVSAMQHEDMLTKLDAAFQAGDAPDVFMERGGGELADHVEAGLLKDLSDSAADTISTIEPYMAGFQVEGRSYALPYSIGVVGFWYNKALFQQAGITQTPTTMDELYAVIDQLKAAGITPVSVGAGDKWPAAHYWYYNVIRECSQETLESAIANVDYSDPCFVKAGQNLEGLIAKEPFNAGFLTTQAQAGPTSASGLLATRKVAMELAGHWEPGVMQGLTEDERGLGEDTGWFPYPSFEGQQGDPEAQMGGGDAWAVSQDAPDIAVEFAQYLLSDEVQRRFAELDMGLPTNPTASQYVSDPALAELLDVRDNAPSIQLYLDTLFGTSVGGAMNDEIALLFAGQASPEDVVNAVQSAADAEQ